MTPEVDAANMIHNEIKVYHSKSEDPIDLLKTIDQRQWVSRYEEDEKNNIDLNFI